MHFLICRTRTKVCGFALTDVVEVMRMLPVERAGAAEPWALGTSRIRGAEVPVVSAGSLLGDDGSAPSRLVTFRSPGRGVAIAVDAIDGVSVVPDAVLAGSGRFPPLERTADAHAGLERVLAGAFVLDAGRWTATGAASA